MCGVKVWALMADYVSVLTKRLTKRQRRECPAVCVVTADGRCELLAQLCYPLSPAAFFRRHWRRSALIVHGPTTRLHMMVRETLHGLSLPRLLSDTPSEEIHVWFAVKGGGANESFKTADPEAALACHRAGGSLYFRAPAEASELLVTALTQQLGLSFGALHPDGAPRSEVETFVSRAGHVTNWHFDFMENFTLQLQGVLLPIHRFPTTVGTRLLPALTKLAALLPRIAHHPCLPSPAVTLCRHGPRYPWRPWRPWRPACLLPPWQV